MDLKRSDFLPAYDDEGVRLIVSEMNEIQNKLLETMKKVDVDDIDTNFRTTISYYHECLRRNIRYLNRYLSSIPVITIE